VVEDLIDSLGGWGLAGLCIAAALLAFGETAIMMDLVAPGEAGMVLIGAAAASGEHPLAPIVLAAAAGAVAGDSFSYAIGRRWGRPLINRFELTRRRIGPMIARAERYFATHGGRAVFFGRFVGALRAVVPFVAGIGRLRFRAFLGWNVAASLLWCTAVLTVGYLVGPAIASFVDRLGTAVSVLVLAVIGAIWWRRRRSRRAKGPTSKGPLPAAESGAAPAHSPLTVREHRAAEEQGDST
jgi:membrane protein DedA with SNARE-associated domain